ncbi:ATP-binding protein [Cohnella zeiphila]|uniref:ATP-binding protein n=1 Tax=Cohnella zeiphila TaxID=2761120 RepID=A0A7X0SMN2_9BACL|nr:ATP-binding protein [Cohnella zeiphila]MBB6732777.1 ATP-binding protein [Cohnella zeiphila]
MKLPVLYWEQNLLFDTMLKPWVVYRIPLKPYAHQSPEKKRSTVSAMQQFLHSYHGFGQLLSVTRMMDAQSWMRQRTGQGKEFERYVKAVMQRFAERRPWQRSLYLVVQLAAVQKQLPEVDLSGWHRMGDTLKDLAGMLSRNVAEQFWYRQRGELERERLRMAQSAESLQFNQVNHHLGGERCGPQDIEWLLRRGFFRGLAREPELILSPEAMCEVRVRGEKVLLRPKKSLPVLLASDMVGEEKMKTFVIHHDDSEEEGLHSFQSFFSVVDVPEEIDVIGDEWLYALEDLPFPAEVSLHFQVQTPHEAAGGLQRNRKVLRDQRREYREASEETPITLEWAGKRGRVLENKMQKGMPLVWASTWFNVSASSRKELEERAAQLLQLYSTKQIRIVRSSADQAKAFQLFLPGSAMDKLNRIPMDPKFLAAGMLHGSREIGDPDGDYIGRTLHRIPVLLDLKRPMSKELNRSGAIVIVGTLGAGKSVLKKTLYYHGYNQGGIVFSIDPKNEDSCFALLPDVRQNMLRLDFSAESQTKFNPFRMSTSEERAHGIVLDFLSLLLEGTRTDERADAIMEAVEQTFEREKRDLHVFMAELERIATDSPMEAIRVEAQRCVNRLLSYSRSPFGKFIFARDGEENASVSGARFIIITLAGLPLPKKRSERLQQALTPNERFGLGIMYLVAALGREYMFHSPSDVLKIFGIDESWMLRAFPEGALLIDEIIRMGRSFQVVPLLATQNPGDVAEEETRNNLGSIFCFRTEDPRAIADNLTLLGLDPDDEDMIQAFRELKAGDCYMKDITGRIGRVHIEPTPDDLLAIFNTTPQAQTERREET